MKRSLIIPALAILALAACDDKAQDQTTTSSTETTTEAPFTQTSPAGGDAASDNAALSSDATTTVDDYPVAQTAPMTAEGDTAGNAGPAEGTTAEATPPAPSPETFNEDSAATATQDDTSCGDYAAWVGKPVDEDAVKETGKAYRIVKPGDPMTMDHNPDRINIEKDDAGNATRVWCG